MFRLGLPATAVKALRDARRIAGQRHDQRVNLAAVIIQVASKLKQCLHLMA